MLYITLQKQIWEVILMRDSIVVAIPMQLIRHKAIHKIQKEYRYLQNL